MPAMRERVRRSARDAHASQGRGVSIRGPGRAEGEDSPRAPGGDDIALEWLSVATRGMGAAYRSIRGADGDWCDALVDHRPAPDGSGAQPATRERSGRQPRPIAHGDASDGRRLDRSAYGQAVVQRQAGFLAAG